MLEDLQVNCPKFNKSIARAKKLFNATPMCWICKTALTTCQLLKMAGVKRCEYNNRGRARFYVIACFCPLPKDNRFY